VAHVARNTVRAGRRRSVLVAGLIAAAIAVSVASNVLIRNEKEVAFGGLDLDLWGGLMYMGGADVRVNWWGSRNGREPAFGFVARLDAEADAEAEARRVARMQRREAPEVARMIAATLPSGATVTTMVEGEMPGHPVLVTTADTDDPLVAPMFERVDDRPALAGDQVLMSDGAMRRFSGAVGDTVVVPELGRAQIVGRVRDAGDWTRAVIVLARDREEVVVHNRQHVWLIGGVPRAQRAAVVTDLSRKLAAYGGWDEEGGRLEGGLVRGHPGPLPPSGDALRLAWRPGTLGAAFLLIPVAIVASAAFTVDHRRRMRQAGLLGTVGASASQAVRIATWEALFIGTAGAVAGAVAGVVFAVAGQPVIERLLLRSITGTGLDWVDPVLPAALGVAAAMIAARRPARSAARVPLVVALGGRSTGLLSSQTVRSTVVVAAPVMLLVLLVAGLMSLLRGLQGTTIVIVGAASLAAGPLMVLLARRAGRQRLLVQLALRSVARHRERTAVIVGAATVIAAMSTNNFLVLYAIEGWGGAVRMWGVLLGGGCVLAFIRGDLGPGGDRDRPGHPHRRVGGCTAGLPALVPRCKGRGAGHGRHGPRRRHGPVAAAGRPRPYGPVARRSAGMGVLLLMLVLALAICVSGPVVAVVVALLSRSMPAHPLARRIT
jgi:hypothetical protein